MSKSFMFEEKWNYQFREVLESLSAEEPFSSSDIVGILQTLGYLSNPASSNPFALSFLEVSDNVYVPTSICMGFMNKLVARYEDHYAVQTDEDFETSSSEFVAIAKKFMKKVINKIDYTYQKYSTLLGAYESQKAHLLDKLNRTRSGNRSVSQSGQNAENSVQIYNDTPQTTDVVATMSENQYVSDLTKNSVAGSTASSGSDTYQEAESWDNATMIARLNEIENQYSNVWMNWLNEFDELFVEEVNY